MKTKPDNAMNEDTKASIRAHIENLELEIEKAFRITSELDPKSDIYWVMYRHYKETQSYQKELKSLLNQE
jgi:hypothetical protein